MAKIYWTTFVDRSPVNMSLWKRMAYFAPEPVYKNIAASRPEEDFLVCPGIQDFYKNTFLVRAPFDFTAQIGRDGNLIIPQDAPEGVTSRLVKRVKDKSTYFSMSIRIDYIFATDAEDVIIEQLPAIMEHSDFVSNTRVICGRFNMSKWIRPFDFAFEVVDPTKPIAFKRGDPLYYIRFTSKINDKVEMVHVEESKEINDIAQASLDLKAFVAGNSLEQNYEMASPWIQRLKRTFFKKQKKCPFSFLK